MASPVTPIMPGKELPVTVIGANQQGVQPLPAFVDVQGNVLTRWKLTDEELEQVKLTGEIWLTVSTFFQPFQPVFLSALPPQVDYVAAHLNGHRSQPKPE